MNKIVGWVRDLHSSSFLVLVLVLIVFSQNLSVFISILLHFIYFVRLWWCVVDRQHTSLNCVQTQNDPDDIIAYCKVSSDVVAADISAILVGYELVFDLKFLMGQGVVVANVFIF